MIRMLRWLGLAALACLLAAAPVAAEKAPVRLGEISVSFYLVTGGVVHEVLERLGHPVTVVEGKHADIWPRLGRGEVDLLVAAWLPHAHDAYWAEHGDRAVKLAALYEGARLFWAVPAYVPESQVSGIADLAKPEVARRMVRTLQGIGRGAGSSTRSLKALEAYGLSEKGYEYAFGTWKDRWNAVDRAIKNGRWAVFSMGAPMFLNAAYDLRPLKDPKGILGGANTGTLLAHQSFADKVPRETLEVLRRIRIGLEGVSRLDYLAVVEEHSPREAARIWMDNHPDTVERWFGR